MYASGFPAELSSFAVTESNIWVVKLATYSLSSGFIAVERSMKLKTVPLLANRKMRSRYAPPVEQSVVRTVSVIVTAPENHASWQLTSDVARGSTHSL